MTQAEESKVSLRNLFIFNPKYGAREGDEHKKILFYHPEESETDVKIKDVGFCEAIIQFTSTFTSDDSVNCLRTQKTLQLFYQAEPDFWMILTVNVPLERKSRDNVEYNEYKSDEVYDKVLQEVLKQSYFSFRLFHNTFAANSKGKDADAQARSLKNELERFFPKYIKSLKLGHCDMIDIARSDQYLPLNKLQFLRVHNFIQRIESSFPAVEVSIFLHNDQLVWSEANPSDLHSIYEYLVRNLSADETSPSIHAQNAISHSNGTFIIGPTTDDSLPAPAIYIFNSGQCKKYHLVVYGAQQSVVCLLINSDTKLTDELFEQLRSGIGTQLASISADISDATSKEGGKSTKSSSDLDDSSTKYLFINELNCQHTGTVHLSPKILHKESKLPPEVLNLLTDLYVQSAGKTNSCEVIVKTLNDYWVVKRTSNWRHSFLIFNKSSTLLEISDEANKLFDQSLRDVCNRV